MANLKLGETLCEGVIAKLKANMATRITAINAAYNDGVTVVAPDANSYFAGRQKNVPLPAIFVTEGPTSFKGEGVHGLITTTDILVWMFDQDQTGPALATRLQRQVRAVIESVWDSTPQEQVTATTGPYSGQVAAFRIFPRRTVPGPVFEPEADHGWRSYYVVVFSAEASENG